MQKRLIEHGSSIALVIDKPLLEILVADIETTFELTTNGCCVCVSHLTKPRIARWIHYYRKNSLSTENGCMIECFIVSPGLPLNGKILCILCLNILIEPRSFSAQENGQIIKGGILDKEYLITVLGKMGKDKLDPYFKQA